MAHASFQSSPIMQFLQGNRRRRQSHCLKVSQQEGRRCVSDPLPFASGYAGERLCFNRGMRTTNKGPRSAQGNTSANQIDPPACCRANERAR